MNSPLITAFYVSASFFAIQAFAMGLMIRYGISAKSTAYSNVSWPYAALLALFACFQLAHAYQYGAVNLEFAVAAHKWLNLAYFAVPLLAVVAMERELVKRPGLLVFSGIYAVASLGVLVYNFATPYGFRFSDLSETTRLTLPWGEQILLLRGTTTQIIDVAYGILLMALLYTHHFAKKTIAAGDRWGAVYIWSNVAVFFATTLFDRSIDAGWVNAPYIDGFAFVALSPVMMALVARDIRATLLQVQSERQVLSLEVEQIKRSDSVTRLPNRAGLLQQLGPMLELHQQNGQSLASLLIDVDRLSLVSGTHGHEISDALLAEIARRLRTKVRSSDFVARGEGTSFVVVVSGLMCSSNSMDHSREIAHLFNQKICSIFDRPFTVGSKEIMLRSYTGIAVYPDDGATATGLLESAELALYEAKRVGSESLQMFHSGLREELRENFDLEMELRRALERDQFELRYQPQISARSGRVCGMEALIRWRHPSRGYISPADFIPLAEELGLIQSIGHWVLRTACLQLAAWRRQGYTNLRIAVNLSARQLDSDHLVADLRSLLGRHDLPPRLLELEVTESALIRNPKHSVKQLEELRKLGVRLMLDDFGTGYSSLSYLRMLPVHGFKLDRSFVQRITHNERDLSICAMAIQFADILSMEVVAEGVESERQAELLMDMGCTSLQGYWFAKPLNHHVATKLLEAKASGERDSENATLPPLRWSDSPTRSWGGPQFENTAS
jgi:diguanylate cyclase (GGDEF)-like protein